MAEHRVRHEWNMAADLMALVANCHRDPKRKPAPFVREDFHPLEQGQRQKNAMDFSPENTRLVGQMFARRHS